MRNAAYALLAVAALIGAVALSGCGAKVEGVPNVVATVDGEEITAEQYLTQLHRMFGRDVLRNLIEQAIIVKWAADEKVPVTQEQIDKAIEALKRDGEYEDRVKMLGEDGLRRQLEVEQAVTNLAKKLYKIKDSEIEEAYAMRQSSYVHGPRKRVALVIVDEQKKIEEAAKKIKDGGDFDQVAAEYMSSPFGPPGPFKTWVDPDAEGLPNELAKAVKDTKVGEVSKVFKIESPDGSSVQYGLLKVVAEQGKADLKVEDVRSELEKIVAMQKIQMESADFQKRLNERKKKAKIQINSDDLKAVAASFKNPPEPPAPPPAPGPESAPESKPEAEGSE